MADNHQNQVPEAEAVATAKKEEAFRISQVIYDWAGTLLFAAAVILLIMTFFFRQVTVKGSSMNDTLADRERLLVESFMYTPKAGDVVIITHGENLPEPIIKRVIATEGQTVEINNETGQVYVDGIRLQESYIKGTTRMPNSSFPGYSTENPVTVPAGMVYVMGDNREGSKDSRFAEVGLIPVENIIGKAVLRIYPLNKFGTF